MHEATALCIDKYSTKLSLIGRVTIERGLIKVKYLCFGVLILTNAVTWNTTHYSCSAGIW
ncbi:hypothetical protein GCM10011396_45940 [Undibacterium terreum]|uniref:Uncharacterized protein n=1 Tax=Undibacterium terreum TaxID=1224302 RepID=A0A916UZS8_9BURK|nr:hypothetical protein GCM10011396_45940 [Undibacterium terreum]